MKKYFHRWWEICFSFFFPRFCPGCSIEMMPYERPCCLHCQASLPYTHFETFHNNPVYEKLLQWIPIEQGTALFYFEDNSPLQNIIHQLKFMGQEQLGHWLGVLAAERLRNTPYQKCTAIVPLPLHPHRQRQRGYNQVDLLCQTFASQLNIPYTPNLIQRVKNTQQLSLNKTSDRFEEMHQAFQRTQVDPFEKPHWLLVDDIITTGATLQSCGKSMLVAPKSKLSILAIGCRK
jgi:ComF family protein